MARKRQLKRGHVWEGFVWFRESDGRRYKRYAYGRTQAELAEAKAKLLKERRTAPRVRRAKEDDPTRWKLAQLGERWMAEHVCTLGEQTQAYYRNQLAKRVAPYLYEHVVGQLRKRDVAQWRAALIADGEHSPRNINAATSTLKALYGWMLATWEDVGIANPVAKLKPLDEHTRAIRIFEPGEVQRIAEQHALIRQGQATPRRGSMQTDRAQRLALRDATMTIVLAYCGLRIGELCGLERRHYDDGRERDNSGRIIRTAEVGWLTVEQQVLAASGKIAPTKGKRTREVPILDSVRRAIDWYLEAMPDLPPDGPLFPAMLGHDPATWKPIGQNRWRGQHFKPAARKAGFTSAVPHDLRHTFASVMIERSRGRVTPVRLAKWMGHRDPTITMTTYAHLYDRVDAEIFRDIDAEIFLTQPANSALQSANTGL